MAWVEHTLKVCDLGHLEIGEDYVLIGVPGRDYWATFKPKTRLEANRMAVALKLASKRLEEIGKGLK